MAYYNPNYFPQSYGQSMGNVPQTPQIQNGGFVLVRSEDEARNYPVAFGNSVTFKDETSPYIYCKTMGFSQLDRPIFEKFRLVKEEQHQQIENKTAKSSNPMIDSIKDEILEIWAEIDALKGNKRSEKKEMDRDEQHDANIPDV